MRTVTSPEAAILASLTRTVHKRVKISNGSGTLIDLSSWVEHVSRNEDIDQPVAGLTLEFTRSNGVLQTLSPLRTDSTLNRLDDGITFGPQIDLVRQMTYETAVTLPGVLPNSSDYKLKFKGTTTNVNFGGNPIVVECLDQGRTLVRRWVETKKLYGSGPGVAVETVMQSIHDDTLGAGVVPVWTPTSPSYLVSPAFQQQYQSIMDADVALAQLPGWDVRYKWDDGTSTFRFKFYAPDRTKTVPDYTFGPKDYFGVTDLSLSELDIRNVIIVEYKDVAALGNRTTVTRTDGPSITKYERTPLIIIEGDNSPINTSAEATTMADAALADLKDPKAEFEIVLPYFWPAELGDLYRFTANGVHFNTDQDWAVVAVTDDLSPGKHETKIKVRGKPAGQYMTWLGRGQTIGGGAGGGSVASAPYPFITPLNTEANDSSWNLRFNSLNGSGGGGTNLTYTIKSKKTFGTEATLASGNASAFPKDLAITRDLKQDAVITFTVTDAATGLFASAVWDIPAFVTGISATGTIIGQYIDPASVGPTQTQSRFRCKATHSTSQSISTGTLTALAFDTESYDAGALHTTGGSNSRITVPVGGDTGTWILTAQIQWDTNTSGDRSISIVKNGVTNIAIEQDGATLGTIQNLTGFDDSPAVGDYYEVLVFQNSGGTRTVASANSTFAAVHVW